MTQENNVLMLGIYPWNFPSLNDTVRSMVRAMPAADNNLIYLNPQVEEKSFSMKWTEASNATTDLRIWNPPFSFLPTRYGVHRVREKLASRALRTDISRMLGSNWKDHTTCYVTASTLEQSYELVKELEPRHLIFDILDDNLGFPGIPDEKRSQLKRMFLEIADRASRITAVSHYLVEQTANWTGKSVEYLPNGVDVARFRTVPSNDEPLALQHIPHPRVTFVGAITSWIDLRLVEKAARTLVDHHFVLVGPIFEKEADRDALRNLQILANVHLLGAVPFNEVPYFLHASDVLLLPRTCDAYSLACDPLKLYEYLATGKPTVSTAHPSVERFAEFVQIGTDDDSFIEGIRQALKRSNETAEKQQHIIDSLSWNVRAEKLFQREMITMQ
ncbi:MAG: glycosyltransferase [Tumebacillaceae bacterium]